MVANIRLARGGGRGRGLGWDREEGWGEGLEHQEEPALPDVSCAIMEVRPKRWSIGPARAVSFAMSGYSTACER